MSSAGSFRPSDSDTWMLARLVNDVAVGENQAVGRDDEAGALAALSAAIAAAAQLDGDDRRADLLDGADDGLRIGV